MAANVDPQGGNRERDVGRSGVRLRRHGTSRCDNADDFGALATNRYEFSNETPIDARTDAKLM